MSLTENIVATIETLPIERQREVLNFAEFLQTKEKSSNKQPRKNLYGLWAKPEVDVSDEDIDEMRREMWENFPREDF